MIITLDTPIMQKGGTKFALSWSDKPSVSPENIHRQERFVDCRENRLLTHTIEKLISLHPLAHFLVHSCPRSRKVENFAHSTERVTGAISLR